MLKKKNVYAVLSMCYSESEIFILLFIGVPVVSVF